MKIRKQKSGEYNVWEVDEKTGRRVLAAKVDSLKEARAFVRAEEKPLDSVMGRLDNTLKGLKAIKYPAKRKKQNKKMLK